MPPEIIPFLHLAHQASLSVDALVAFIASTVLLLKR